MNRIELQKSIDSLRYKAKYSLKGGYLEDGYVLNHPSFKIKHKVWRIFRRWFSSDNDELLEDNQWEVYYCERGQLRYYAKDCSEDEACRIMLERIKSIDEILYNPQYCVVRTEEEKERDHFISYIISCVDHILESLEDPSYIMFLFYKPSICYTLCKSFYKKKHLYLEKMFHLPKTLQNSTALYFCFYKPSIYYALYQLIINDDFEFWNQRKNIHLRVSLSSRYECEINKWYWKEELVAKNSSLAFSLHRCLNHSAFLDRVTSYMKEIIAEYEKSNEPYLRDIDIFIGFKNETPVLVKSSCAPNRG